ncbi:MAG TPA: DNA alkylation repair protein [Bacillota bacterium]|nr:DNA alkylation repair protein [Bacillota bacterium]HPZ11406.1 DNA alkylation repair protein [Bacillota bacterium]HQE10302.1 DNA alkylation repair protein [Bacillota bacterium]
MSCLNSIKKELARLADPEKAKHSQRFFQAFPGGYGEGDRFLGLTVPLQRKVAGRYYREITLDELEALLRDPFHECRLTALYMMRLRFERARTAAEKEAIVELFLRNLDCINNWDLVDSSAPYILGPYLAESKSDLLCKLASSGELWKQRIAMMATFYFIRQGRYRETLCLAEKYLDHPHDLIHKATGWMLREIGNRDQDAEIAFLKKHYRQMPRTMLRYAIEKFDPPLREQFLKGLA